MTNHLQSHWIKIWDAKSANKERRQEEKEEKCTRLEIKALHSKLLTELSSRFSSRNEFLAISELRV